MNFLQVNDNTCLVVLSKEEGSGLGFSIAGGVDLGQKAITVSTVCRGSGTYCSNAVLELSDDVHCKLSLCLLLIKILHIL